MTATAYANQARFVESNRVAKAPYVAGAVVNGVFAGLCIWGTVVCVGAGGGWIVLAVILGLNAVGFVSLSLGALAMAIAG